MAKAALLTKSEDREFRAEHRVIGEALDEARRVVGWTVERLAQELDRNKQQVGRWISGEERTQTERVFGIKELQQPFVIALAKRAGCAVKVAIYAEIA